MSERADCALRAAETGGSVALESFRGDVAVETKSGKTDVVTQADRDAQRRVTATIREAYPDDPIDGTNNYVRGVPVWTTSVAATVDGEAVAGASVCPAFGDTFLLENGTARFNGEVLSVSDRTDPETFAVAPTMWWEFDRREEYVGICRGILERFGDMRRYGSAQYALALCATGALDAVVTNVEAYPWDSVVGAGLVEAAGGVVTDIEGEPWRHDSTGLVASNGEAHEAVLSAAREAHRER